MTSINNNLMAANVAGNLNSHYGRLASSVERLSSGLRINRAGDDAAGLAIRELMRADIAALRQGTRNANDAISMLQVADGALAIIDEKLIRMKELAEQAATGTYNSIQRLMIDSEFQAMGAEIDRIANATDFNGIHLLNGSLSGEHNGAAMNAAGKMKIHFGTGNDSAEDYYYVEIGDCTTAGLGLREKSPFAKLPASLSWINEAQIDYVGMQLILDVPNGVAGHDDAAFMKGLDYYGLPVGLKNITITSNSTNAHPFHKPHMCLFSRDGTQLTGPAIQGQTVLGPPHPFPGNNPVPDTKDNANWWNNHSPGDVIRKGIAEGVFDANATYSDAKTSMLPGTQSHGNLVITQVTGQNELGSMWAGSNVWNAGVATDEITKINEITNDLVFFIGGHDAPDCNKYRLRIEAEITDTFLQKLKGWTSEEGTASEGGMLTIDTQQKAQDALVAINEAIVKKDGIRAHLGALQNRLENTVTNLTIQGENLQAAEARISDADVAREMTNFVRNQVLTQSAIAMLGQANSYPHMLSGLLNG